MTKASMLFSRSQFGSQTKQTQNRPTKHHGRTSSACFVGLYDFCGLIRPLLQLFVVGSGVVMSLLTGVSTSAYAMSFDWGGTYRLEYTSVDKPSLVRGAPGKSYFLNHLNLRPKILAYDGVEVVSNIELLGNSAYPDSQLGTWYGSGSRSVASNSSVVNTNQNSSNLQVNQLYLMASQEFGSLLAGRVPLHFGLGMTTNSGTGPFDHWNQTRDLIGYKFIIGNFFFMPMIGKIYDDGLQSGGDSTEQILHVEYDNPETESAIGFFYTRVSTSPETNDAASAFGGTAVYGYQVARTNMFLARGFEGFKFKMEVGFDGGSTGLVNSAGDDVKVSAYGVVINMDFPSAQSRWQWNVRLGLASGDNPNTSSFEGYYFNRNYDIGLILFNHPLGSYDVLRTAPYRYKTACGNSSAPCSNYPVVSAADEETVSNAYFLAPSVTYQWTDRWQWVNTLVWAQAQANPIVGEEPGRSIGYEWDTGLMYKVSEKIRWKTDLGLFLPGSVWRAGSQGLENGFNTALRSAVSIGF